MRVRNVGWIFGALLAPALSLAGSSQIDAQSAEIGNIGNDASFDFNLFHDGDRSDGALVSYRTRDGTAIAGQDYRATSGRVNLGPGTLRTLVPVPIYGEPGPQPDKQFTLELTQVVSTGGPESFGAFQQFAGAADSLGTHIADLNGDGLPDVMTTGFYEAPGHFPKGSLQLLLNATPAGATETVLSAPQAIDLSGRKIFCLAVGDLNGDGRRDLITVDSYGANGWTFLNWTPKGADHFTFGKPKNFFMPGPAYSVAVADLDGDGRLDLLGMDWMGRLTVLLNRTAPGATAIDFPQHATFDGLDDYVHGDIVVRDFNHDHKPDVAMFGASSLLIWRNVTVAGADTAAFEFQNVAVAQSGGAPQVADFNGDGKPDLAYITNDQLVVLLNRTVDGATTFQFAPAQTFPSGGNVSSMTAGDFNGDGVTDLAIGNGSDETVSLLYNVTPRGGSKLWFSPPRKFAAGPAGDYVHAIGSGDLNHDGRTDLAATISFKGDVVTLLNTLVPPTLSAPATATIHYPAP